MLRLYFIARDDLDDFLNLRQRWLWCVWRWTALLRLSKRWHRGESGDGEDKFEFHDRVPRLCFRHSLVMSHHMTLCQRGCDSGALSVPGPVIGVGLPVGERWPSRLVATASFGRPHSE